MIIISFNICFNIKSSDRSLMAILQSDGDFVACPLKDVGKMLERCCDKNLWFFFDFFSDKDIRLIFSTI